MKNIASVMGRLDDITLEELHEVREQTDGEKPLERVLAAVGRKQGDQIDTLAERHGVVEKTIHNWLPTTLLDQEARRNSNPENASNCSNSCKNRRLNSGTTSRHGRRNFYSITSTQNTALSTARATRTRC